MLILGMFLSACAQTDVLETHTETSTMEGTLRPYPTETETATPLPTGYNSPTPSPTITPTPTQVFYEVQSGDDMYSIANRFGVEPSALMTANPTVNPSLLQVGTSLLIPVTLMPEATPTVPVEISPTPTGEQQVSLSSPDCYPDALGGLWCFVLASNNQDGDLENVSGLIVLGEGENARQEIGVTPLNLLPADESLPLVAYFQPPVSPNATATAALDFVLPVMSEDDRYLPVELAEPNISLRNDNKIAEVSGAFILPADQPDAEYVWVVATAFDADGRIVGVRRWESEGSLAAGASVSFDLLVYSMGEAIDRVDLLSEARRLRVSPEG